MAFLRDDLGQVGVAVAVAQGGYRCAEGFVLFCFQDLCHWAPLGRGLCRVEGAGSLRFVAPFPAPLKAKGLRRSPRP
ncbi:hypothetical protein GCM10010372_27210 [Streptomyces tauricus]|nr:hypothetical protein GCM10010372_27210 [Streptomyces tauricus]